MPSNIGYKRGLSRIRLIVLAVTAAGAAACVAALSVVSVAADLMVVPPRTDRKERKRASKAVAEPDEEPSWLATTTNEKLAWIIAADVTSAEIAIATGSSLRAVEDRRRRLKADETKRSRRVAKLDSGIDALFSIFSLLERHAIEPTNIRAWLIGRSAYLEEQRPAILLSANEFELVRDAAIAYASGETPAEFLADRGPLPRPAEPAEV